MRFYLLDRITEIIPGDYVKGIKAWTLSEDFFEEHFPGFPVVPGVLLIESMAQILGYLAQKSYEAEFLDDSGGHMMLSMIHKAKFRDYVVPGDQCVVTGKLKSLDRNRCMGTTTIHLDDKCMAEAALSFIILQKDMVPNNEYLVKRYEYWHNLTLKRMRGV